jgi:hypothetical protein
MPKAKQQIIRPAAHEIDTAACSHVPSLLPRAWEPRLATGRDYGIDMHVELFHDKKATGRYLLLQIKGTTKSVSDRIERIGFDLLVSTLKYAEFFVVPVLLVLAPIDQQPSRFYFLWLQDYIKVVLDHERPEWRLTKQKTIRVFIPTGNKIPGDEGRLSFIANFPRRLFEWTQIARLQHEIAWSIERLGFNDFTDTGELQRLRAILDVIRRSPAIYGDPSWVWANIIRIQHIEPAVKVTDIFLRGEPYSLEDVRSLGVLKLEPNLEERFAFMLLKQHLITLPNTLSANISLGNDFSIKRTQWVQCGEHDF